MDKIPELDPWSYGTAHLLLIDDTMREDLLSRGLPRMCKITPRTGSLKRGHEIHAHR